MKSRIALISCLCGGCYVGFYNPKKIDTNFSAFWRWTSTVKTGSVRVGFSMKPEPAPRTEVRKKMARQYPNPIERSLQEAGKVLGADYTAAKRTASKAKSPRG
ncbi:hypothetical protein ACXR0O_27725 [Verrucomicrobiota bacterium sgz303538]